MNYTVDNITEKSQWEKFISQHPEANFLHSWQWGEFHLRRGRNIVRRGVYKDGKLCSVYVGFIETARRGTHLAIAGGPIGGWDKKPIVNRLMQDIREQGKQNNCVFVRIRPQLEKNTKTMQQFEELGFRISPMHLSVERAGILDLKKSEEEIMQGMRPRLRRALRKAEKNNISVETSVDPDSIDDFYDIQLQTAGRHKFVPFSRQFLKDQFSAFAESDNVLLYTAKHEGQILAQNFMIFYGNEASYHYGVSTELGTKLSGAPLLHMEAMREARKRGCERYNFWGIVDETETKHRFFGVSTFKRGFGVQDLEYVPTHDLVLKPLQYRAVWLLETARSKHRSL